MLKKDQESKLKFNHLTESSLKTKFSTLAEVIENKSKRTQPRTNLRYRKTSTYSHMDNQLTSFYRFGQVNHTISYFVIYIYKESGEINMFNVLMYFLTKTIDSNMGRLDLLYAFVWGLLFMHSRFKSKNVTKKNAFSYVS